LYFLSGASEVFREAGGGDAAVGITATFAPGIVGDVVAFALAAKGLGRDGGWRRRGQQSFRFDGSQLHLLRVMVAVPLLLTQHTRPKGLQCVLLTVEAFAVHWRSCGYHGKGDGT